MYTIDVGIGSDVTVLNEISKADRTTHHAGPNVVEQTLHRSLHRHCNAMAPQTAAESVAAVEHLSGVPAVIVPAWLTPHWG